MACIGSIFQTLGLLSGIAAAILYALGLRSGRTSFRSGGNVLRFLMFAFICLAFVVLCYAVFADNFNLRYVALYSDRSLPLIYKAGVLWAGQPGALLTACLFLSFLGLLEIWRLEKKTDIKYICAVNMVSVLLCCALLFLVVFIANPFTELDFIPLNGAGIPPIFQNIYLFLCPLFVCFWISSSALIFSHASAALITGDVSSYWINKSRLWVYAAWILAATSIFVGSLWSYSVCGAFWSWSAPEMTAVLALLSALSLIHTSYIYKTKECMKWQSFFYALLLFETALFFMYLLHDGSKDTITPFKYDFFGAYMPSAMLISAFFFVIAVAFRIKKIKPACRTDRTALHTAMQILNLGFLTVIFFILAGVLFQTVAGEASSPGKYYMLVIIPLGVLSVLSAFFVRLYSSFKAGSHKISLNGAISHAGVVLVVAGIVLSSVFCGSEKVVLYMGESASFHGYTLTLNGVQSIQKDNYVSTFIKISLSSDKKMLGNIYPEIRGYNNSNNLTAETKSVFSRLGVVTVAFLSYDFLSGEATLLMLDYPFVFISAAGFVLLLFGASLAVIRRGWNN